MVCSILICSHVILCGLADSKYLFSYTHWFRCFMKGNRFSVFEVYSKTVLNKRVRYSCIPVCSLRAGPSRCGAQYETQTRGPFYYDVIVFSQPCNDLFDKDAIKRRKIIGIDLYVHNIVSFFVGGA